MWVDYPENGRLQHLKRYGGVGEIDMTDDLPDDFPEQLERLFDSDMIDDDEFESSVSLEERDARFELSSTDFERRSIELELETETELELEER